MSGYSLLRRDRTKGVHGEVAAFIKSAFSHGTVADSRDDQLEVLAFKIYGPREIQLDIIVVYRPPSPRKLLKPFYQNAIQVGER